MIFGLLGLVTFICLLVYTASCPSSSRRIVGGQVAENELKWMVNIFATHADNDTASACGGMLMEKDHKYPYRTILTAASCVFMSHPDEIWIEYGRDPDRLGIRPVSSIIHHSFLDGWQRDTDMDIAILHVDIPHTEYITTIKEPDDDPPCEHYIAGYGTAVQQLVDRNGNLMNEYNNTDIHGNTILRNIEVNLMNLTDCRNFKHGPFTKVQDTEVCFQYFNVGPCYGDDGGPLYYTTDFVHYYLRGIISWYHGCGNGRAPSVATDLLHPDVMHWYTTYSDRFVNDPKRFNYFAGVPVNHKEDPVSSPRTHTFEFPLIVVYDPDE